ncbi:hypothetical protein ES702_01689 [subsurface metagenome]
MILPITSKVGDFVDGEVVTGQTSGAKGIVATHFLRCQGQVNPSNVAIPVKFKAVFEPAGAGVPPAEKGIALTGVEGTFQDGETVVGGTSGATAEVDEWVSMRIYAYAGGGGAGEGEPKALYLSGTSTIDFDTAWEHYQGYTPHIRIDEHIEWFCDFGPAVYSVTGQEICISFNTGGAPVGASIITLNIDIDDINNYSGDPVLKIYRLDELFDPSHWLTGGTFITSETITATGVHSYPLTYAHINLGGWSRFRISSAMLEAQQKPEAQVEQMVRCREDIEDYAYLEFTR